MPEKKDEKKTYKFLVRICDVDLWIMCCMTPEELEGASQFSRALVNMSPDESGLSIKFCGYSTEEKEK